LTKVSRNIFLLPLIEIVSNIFKKISLSRKTLAIFVRVLGQRLALKTKDKK
jgi:hypothetical protein